MLDDSRLGTVINWQIRLPQLNWRDEKGGKWMSGTRFPINHKRYIAPHQRQNANRLCHLSYCPKKFCCRSNSSWARHVKWARHAPRRDPNVLWTFPDRTLSPSRYLLADSVCYSLSEAFPSTDRHLFVVKSRWNLSTEKKKVNTQKIRLKLPALWLYHSTLCVHEKHKFIKRQHIQCQFTRCGLSRRQCRHRVYEK